MTTWTARLGIGIATAAAALLTTGAAAFADTGAPAGVTPQIGPPCAVGRLCVFDGPQFTGHRVDLYRCGIYDVRSSGLTRVASFVNNQTNDQVATFTATTGQQYNSTAVDANSDTSAWLTTYLARPC